MRARRSRSAGFTLVEAVVAIAASGAVLAGVAMFARVPIQGAVDQQRRAELTDTADGALRRMGRDIRLALPNSLRVATAGGTTYLELLQTRTGGRYRASADSAGAGDFLNFAAVDNSFDMLGGLPSVTGQAIQAGDRVVVYNLGITGSDAYAGTNSNVVFSTAAGTLANEGKINLGNGSLGSGVIRFPFASPANRFHVVSGPVTYACNPAAGTLTRVSGYTIQAAQPTGSYGGSPVTGVLAGRVSACSITYTSGVTERSGLVSIQLVLSADGESVSLYHEVQVNNVP
jgi:MSHA biogenesis protein MshO